MFSLLLRLGNGVFTFSSLQGRGVFLLLRLGGGAFLLLRLQGGARGGVTVDFLLVIWRQK